MVSISRFRRCVPYSTRIESTLFVRHCFTLCGDPSHCEYGMVWCGHIVVSSDSAAHVKRIAIDHGDLPKAPHRQCGGENDGTFGVYTESISGHCKSRGTLEGSDQHQKGIRGIC